MVELVLLFVGVLIGGLVVYIREELRVRKEWNEWKELQDPDQTYKDYRRSG